mgnify:FL=1
MHKLIINQFIKQFKAKHSQNKIEVLAILGFGSSFRNKKIRDNSDLDLYVVIKNVGKRWRGVMLAGSIAVDYFVYPIEQLKADWNKVKNKIIFKQTIVYMLRDSRIILDKTGELKKMRAAARSFLKNELNQGAVPPAWLILNKYFIDDYLKDIVDSYRNKDIFSWQYNFNLLLNNLLEIFCKFHKIPLVKPKYQSTEIIKKDTKFVALYNSIARVATIKEKTNKINQLAFYCLTTMGGPLPKEWELERPLER